MSLHTTGPPEPEPEPKPEPDHPSTTSIDPLIAHVLASQAGQKPKQKGRRSSADSASSASSTTSSLDALFSADPTTAALRAARLQQLQSEQARLAAAAASNPHPHSLTLLESEKEAIAATAAADASVLLFTHDGFAACARMGRLLGRLAPLHPEARVLAVRAEESAWLAGKLGVRVLPVVVGFVKGEEKGRVVGFEGLELGLGEEGMVGAGGAEGEVLRALERQGVRWGVFGRVRVGEDVDVEVDVGGGEGEAKRRGGNAGGIRDRNAEVWNGGKKRSGEGRDEDEDDDWD